MSETRYYHLQTRGKLQVLPQLLQLSLSRNWNVMMVTGQESQISVWDEHLWTYESNSFLPHNVSTAENPEQQPVLISRSGENLNNAHVIFLVDGAPLIDVSSYALACRVFDGNDDIEVQGARTAWKQEKETGRKLTYWQQDDLGKWAVKSEANSIEG